VTDVAADEVAENVVRVLVSSKFDNAVFIRVIPDLTTARADIFNSLSSIFP
jgi:hypothetical protein